MDYARATPGFVALVAMVLHPLGLLFAAEPVLPPACKTLRAQLSFANGGVLGPADETRLDTSRLQRALDGCGRGQSVRLMAADNSRRIFLTGPLQLPRGITFVLERGVVLMASREARDFQVKQGSCGVVEHKGQGCHALISCAVDSPTVVAGAGAIDGRGGSAILGETYSWWDLAQEARLTGGKVNAPPLIDDGTCRDLKISGVTLKNSPQQK